MKYFYLSLPRLTKQLLLQPRGMIRLCLGRSGRVWYCRAFTLQNVIAFVRLTDFDIADWN